MADQARSEIIQDNPIGKGLDAFRASFTSVCENQSIPSTLNSLGKLGHHELQNIALVLLSTLQILPATRLLRSSGGSVEPKNTLPRFPRDLGPNSLLLQPFSQLRRRRLPASKDYFRLRRAYHESTTTSFESVLVVRRSII